MKNFEEPFNYQDLLNAVDNIFPLSEHYKEILKVHLSVLKDCKRVVDLGCGTGILTIEYLKEGKLVTGVDISVNSLKILREKARKLFVFDNLVLVKADMTNLDQIKDNSFDGASSMIAAHLVKNYKDFIYEIYRILENGGKFIITARCKNQDQEKIIQIVKNSLLEINKFEEYEKDFIVLRDKLLKTAKERSYSLLTIDEAKEILFNVGFRNIQEMSNKSQGVMYSLFAEKQ